MPCRAMNPDGQPVAKIDAHVASMAEQIVATASVSSDGPRRAKTPDGQPVAAIDASFSEEGWSTPSSTAGVSTPQWAKDLLKKTEGISSRVDNLNRAGEDATDEFFRSLLRENPSSRAARQHFAKKGSL